MFFILLLGLVFAVGGGLWPMLDGGAPRFLWLASAVPLGAGVAGVAGAMSQHPDGVRDWTQGGVVDLHITSCEIRWLDWAIFMTRKGCIDLVGRQLVMERRMFFSLIPLGTVRRSLDAFYRVEVNATHTEDEYGNSMSMDYEVNLVDRRADRLCLLDLTTGGEDERGAQFILSMAETLQMIVGSTTRQDPPGRNGRASSGRRRGGGRQPVANGSPGAGRAGSGRRSRRSSSGRVDDQEDFESWRRRQGK